MGRTFFEIAGRTVLITGAARGIGAAAAARAHSRGANVALVGLEPERLEALAAQLGDRAAAFEADVTDTAALERAAAETVRRFGAIDVAIANAGIAYVGALATAPTEHVERTIDVNLLGVWRTDRAVLPHIVERNGYLLNVASLAAVGHMPLMGAYAASKAGVEALTNVLRAETRATGAGVGCAYFGFIDTDMVRGGLGHPAGRLAHELLPGVLGRAIPVEAAVDAIDRAIRRRSARAWAPGAIGPALLARGVVQPLTELALRGRRQQLGTALRLASDQGALDAQDATMGSSLREP